jgi:hypothetical protein
VERTCSDPLSVYRTFLLLGAARPLLEKFPF